MRAGRLETAASFGKALALSLLDSDRVDQLLIGEEISSVGRMTALIPLMRATEEGRAILAERPRLTSQTVDVAALKRLPEGTLGRGFVEHLARHALDLDALDVRVTRGQSDVENYLLERVRQTHDIWHTLLALGTAGHEEVLVHAFQWPQLRMPYSALVVGFGSIKHLVGERRWGLLRRGLWEAARAGREAASLLPIYWERHWDEPLDALRARLNIRRAARWAGLEDQGNNEFLQG